MLVVKFIGDEWTKWQFYPQACWVVLYIHSHGKGEVISKSKKNNYYLIEVTPTIPLNIVGTKY